LSSTGHGDTRFINEYISKKCMTPGKNEWKVTANGDLIEDDE
jgi:hypothetical protein